jgi:hypothetical protein
MNNARCPTCGSACRIVAAQEGTHAFGPVEVDEAILDAALREYDRYGRVGDEAEFVDAMRSALEAAFDAAHRSASPDLAGEWRARRGP